VLEGPVLVRYQLTRQDVADVARVTRRSERRVMAAYPLVIVAVVGLVLALDLGWVLALTMGASLLVVLLLMLRRLARSLRVAVGGVITVELSPNGVSYEIGRRSARLPWAGLEARQEGPVLVLARSGRPVLVIPARDLSPSDLDAVAAWSASAPKVAPDLDVDSDGEDSCQEWPDGQLVVRGRLTLARSRAIAESSVRAAAWRRLNLATVAALVLAWAITVPRLRAGEGPPVDLLILTVLVGLSLGLVAVAKLLIARAMTSVLGRRRLEWRYSPLGATTIIIGEAFVDWSLVRNAVVRRDMLVVRRKGSQSAAGFLLGPLSPEQRRRVIGWVEAGSGKGVTGAR
jgi:hypothetical protein